MQSPQWLPIATGYNLRPQSCLQGYLQEASLTHGCMSPTCQPPQGRGKARSQGRRIKPKGKGAHLSPCPCSPTWHRTSPSPPYPHPWNAAWWGGGGGKTLGVRFPLLSPESREDGYISREENAFF